MKEDRAAALALNALEYLASGGAERLGPFLAMSGHSPAGLAAAAARAETQAAILDYLCRNERVMLDFCEAAACEPRDIYHALKALDPHYDMSSIALPPSRTRRR